MYKNDNLYFRKVKNKNYNNLTFHAAILDDFLLEFSSTGAASCLLAVDYDSGEIIGETPFYVMKDLSKYIDYTYNNKLFTVPYIVYNKPIQHPYNLTNEKLVFPNEPTAVKRSKKCIIY